MTAIKTGGGLEKIFRRQEMRKEAYEKEKLKLQKKQDAFEAKKRLGLIKRKPLKYGFGKTGRLRG